MSTARAAYRFLTRTPVLGRIVRRAWTGYRNLSQPFPGSREYWEKRYRSGGTSGAGSYGEHATFKAQFLNRFVAEHQIRTVLEWGSGDGNQLSLAEYNDYTGVDVSPAALAICRLMFAGDPSKTFHLDEGETSAQLLATLNAELALSLDVIYHLVEDDVFELYMTRLFDSAIRYVVIFSTNVDRTTDPHVRHRNFQTWIARNRPNWRLASVHRSSRAGDIPRRDSELVADFYVYELRFPPTG
jgi:hypothetical protein